MDDKSAFLNDDLHEEIYMAQPQGFVKQGSEHLVCKLKKSIYGLKKSPREWCALKRCTSLSHCIQGDPWAP